MSRIEMTQAEMEKAITEAWSKGSMFMLHICKKSWLLRTAAADLGLSEKDIPKNVRLGNKLMLPEGPVNKINNIEGQARRILDRYSYIHPVGCRFVRHEHMVHLAIALEEKRKEFMLAVADLVENYDKYQEQMQREIPEQYLAMRSFYTPVGSWRGHYSYQVKSWVLAYKGEVSQADLQAEIERRQLTEAHAKALRDSFVQQNQQYVKDMAEFAKHTMEDLRGNVSKVFQDVIQRWAKNKESQNFTVHGKTLIRLQEIIQQFNEMQFLPDPDFRKHLDQVQEHLTNREAYSSDADLMAALTKEMQATVELDLRETKRQAEERFATVAGKRLINV